MYNQNYFSEKDVNYEYMIIDVKTLKSKDYKSEYELLVQADPYLKSCPNDVLLMIFLCNDNIKQLSILLGYTAILGTTITRIWVDERCRKRGIATTMLSDLMGAESLTINSVFIPKSHKYLVKVFEKLGFQVYKDYGDLIFMVFN